MKALLTQVKNIKTTEDCHFYPYFFSLVFSGYAEVKSVRISIRKNCKRMKSDERTGARKNR